MKVVFAGPSIYGLDIDWQGLQQRAPAALGDLSKATGEGATMIGLVDGYFGWTPTVWHKEILHALAMGVQVYGASSLGALRAAECAAFGMIAVGEIARAYVSGALDDDGDVALLHYPAEAGYLPMTEPLVDVRATLDALRAAGRLAPSTYDALWHRAHALNFRHRTLDALAQGLAGDEAAAFLQNYGRYKISLKAQDALELIEIMRSASPEKVARSWEFEQSFPWKSAGLDQ